MRRYLKGGNHDYFKPRVLPGQPVTRLAVEMGTTQHNCTPTAPLHSRTAPVAAGTGAVLSRTIHLAVPSQLLLVLQVSFSQRVSSPKFRMHRWPPVTCPDHSCEDVYRTFKESKLTMEACRNRSKYDCGWDSATRRASAPHTGLKHSDVLWSHSSETRTLQNYVNAERQGE